MNPLVPEVRTNKLGVPVKKYVRASPATSLGKVKMPAPSIAPQAYQPRGRQLKQRAYSISYVGNKADARFERHPLAGPDFSFTANDIEVYAVMSVTGTTNALELLERGVRSAEEAETYLTEMNAQDLIIDRSGFMSEMLERNVPAHLAAQDIMMASVLKRVADTEYERLPNAADTTEFGCIASFKNLVGNTTIKDDILSGEISFADIKAIGISRLKTNNHLHDLRATLKLLHSGQARFTNEDVQWFIDKSDNGPTQPSSFKSAVVALHYLSTDDISKLDKLGYFGNAYRVNADDKQAEAERAFYAAYLQENIVDVINAPSRYWGQEFKAEVDVLRDAGVPVEQAVQHMNKGLNANQVIGVINGINPSLADGWL